MKAINCADAAANGHGKLMKIPPAGEVVERLEAAVC